MAAVAADGQHSGTVDIRVLKRSVRVAGHPTSISLEEPFWAELKRIAAARGLSLNALITEVDSGRGQANLSSALRLLVVADLRRRAGHDESVHSSASASSAG